MIIWLFVSIIDPGQGLDECKVWRTVVSSNYLQQCIMENNQEWKPNTYLQLAYRPQMQERNNTFIFYLDRVSQNWKQQFSLIMFTC